ncbi:hypothetical protein [Chelativorans sp. Marseille-P2723]|uniref:hypothetical protein n=1 Tax=Chelativorans sp. Marseille-P2723 TaxID=2709133 RepID=UPI0015706B48|nr:hypothetical protein [Chelativorans sp. Marseille-P2723]
MAKYKKRSNVGWMLPALAITAAFLAGGWTEPSEPGAFYQVEAEEITGSPGDILRIEPFNDAPQGAQAWRVLYVSTDMTGKAIPVSGVIIAPGGAAPAGGRPVVWHGRMAPPAWRAAARLP